MIASTASLQVVNSSVEPCGIRLGTRGSNADVNEPPQIGRAQDRRRRVGWDRSGRHTDVVGAVTTAKVRASKRRRPNNHEVVAISLMFDEDESVLEYAKHCV